MILNGKTIIEASITKQKNHEKSMKYLWHSSQINAIIYINIAISSFNSF